MPFFYFDSYYLLLVLPALAFSLWASVRVKSTFRKYSQQYNRRGMTGFQAAQAVLRANGVTDVPIRCISGDLNDHYDPKNKTIFLSEAVYHGANTASVGVAAHEAGHAVQYAQEYLPVRIRAAIIPVTNIGSRLSVPLIVFSLALSALNTLRPYRDILYFIAMLGVLGFGLCVVFQLITLPVEYNASRRAKAAIAQGELLTEEEQKGAKKVLSAAALTYVAALALSLAQLLRLLLLVNRRRK